MMPEEIYHRPPMTREQAKQLPGYEMISCKCTHCSEAIMFAGEIGDSTIPVGFTCPYCKKLTFNQHHFEMIKYYSISNPNKEKED